MKKNNQSKLFDQPATFQVSGFEFLFKNYKMFNFSEIERKFNIPAGTLKHLLKGTRKPTTAHRNALENFKNYIQHELNAK